MNPRKNDGFSARELVPMPGEYARPAVPEPVVGDYYYGRPQNKSAVARAYLQLLARQRWTIIITFLLVLLLGMAWTLTRPAKYRATAEMLVTPMDRGESSGDNLAADIGVMTRVRSVATEMKMLDSPDLLDEAFADVPEALRVKGFKTHASSLGRYAVDVTNARDTDVIGVEVTAGNPDAAAFFANQILRTNLQRSEETTKNIAELATQHVVDELSKCDTDLKATTAALADIQQRTGIMDISSQAAINAQSLANLETAAAQAKSESIRGRISQSLLGSELRKASPTVVASINEADNPVLQTIDTQIQTLQQQKATMLQEYLPSAPEIQSINQQINDALSRKAQAMRKKSLVTTTARNPVIDTLTENYVNAIVGEQESAGRAAIMQAQAGLVKGRIAKMPHAQEKITLLNSHIAELQSTHAYLNQQKQALTLSMNGGLPNAMPITSARANPFPVSPNIPASIMLLIVLGALLSIGLAVVLDQFDDHLHTSEAVETLTGRHVLVCLPQVRHGFRGLVTHESCPPALLESFRILRGNFLLSMLDPLPRTVMVTSAQAGDGKSTTVANLAATIAMNGKRVLLMDCDMRHPSIHLIYGMTNAKGLSTVLQGTDDFADSIQSSDVENLDVLAAGPTPSRPPELLASATMQEVIEQARQQYDCVLLDSPPMINLSDGPILAAQAEGVLLVVSSDRTRQPELQNALRTLEQIGIPILGLIYNRAEETAPIEWKG
jgi:capsular exopolysaccharide synthesis family protein